MVCLEVAIAEIVRVEDDNIGPIGRNELLSERDRHTRNSPHRINRREE